MKLRSAIAAGALALSVAAGTAACGVSGFQPAYVVGRTMCGVQYCLVMSDGDVVTVNQGIWDGILYGMILQSTANGGYHFTRGSYATRPISTVSYSRYRTVTRVSPSSEYSQQRSGTTYNDGGSKYTSSPKYKAAQAQARAAKVAAAQQAKSNKYGSTKSGYNPTKTTYSNTKSGYSSYKSSSFRSSKY
jgi:hypothetical protein